MERRIRERGMEKYHGGGEIERGSEILKKLERDREKELEVRKRERDGGKREGGGRERERDEGIERRLKREK